MPWNLLPPLSRTAFKTLSIFSTLHGRIPRSFHSSSDGELLIRFSELVNRFSKPNNPAPPSPGARPRHPHPFDYISLMKSFARAGKVEEVLRLFDEMRDSNFRLDVPIYTTVIDALVTSHRSAQALTVFGNMISSGFSPDVTCCTVLVKLYSCYLKQFDSAYEVVSWMLKCGCRPDVITYSTLITGLSWDGRVEEALGVLDLMLEEECRPNVHTFTPIVQAYCALGRIRDAKRLVETMESIGCLPNVVTYNVLIEALCKIGELNEVEKVLGESRIKGWEPDVFTFSIYMSALCRRGETELAFEKLEVMIGKGITPSVVTLNILLDCLSRGSKAWKAKCLLERSAELGWDVDVVNYNTVMSRLCDSGRWFSVMKLFADMFKKGVAANTWTFSIVINSLCKAGKLRKAKCIFYSNGFVANVVSYTTLIHNFYLVREMAEVESLYSKMGVDKVSPNVITYSVMVDYFCRQGKFDEAMECFHRSLVDGYSPHLVACLTNVLIRGGMTGSALKLLEQISQQGWIVDTCIFCSLIKAFCAKGFCKSREIDIVCHILDKMLGTR